MSREVLIVDGYISLENKPAPIMLSINLTDLTVILDFDELLEFTDYLSDILELFLDLFSCINCGMIDDCREILCILRCVLESFLYFLLPN